MTAAHTRVHLQVGFANPYLRCDRCGGWVTAWHDDARCGCGTGMWIVPCEHAAGVTSACPSWGPVDGPVYGCRCVEQLGHVPHEEPPVEGAAT